MIGYRELRFGWMDGMIGRKTEEVMYTINEVDGKFELFKDGIEVGTFLTRADAEKAQTVSEGTPPSLPVLTGTYVDDGQGLDYPVGTDNVHSGYADEDGDVVLRPKTPGGVPATTHTIAAATAHGEILDGKTIASVSTFQHGSVFVVELLCTDGNRYYLKTKCGALEIGGTQEWDTGVKR